MAMIKGLITLAMFFLSVQVFAAPKTGKYFDRAIFIVFENTNFSSALKQPFFRKLGSQGALFTNFTAITHPSQGNYIALTSGSLNGVHGDGKVDLDVKNVVDLLEARGVTWRVYAEDYPGNCFTGGSNGAYARKHNPFISYVNIQTDAKRCANIVNADQFDKDAAAGNLPEYVFYIPNLDDDGHDTGADNADKWYSQKFGSYIGDAQFMDNTILVTTFDESGGLFQNQIYTSIVGSGIRPDNYAQSVNTYSLLALVEENWNLGDLGKSDASAAPIPNIWK